MPSDDAADPAIVDRALLRGLVHALGEPAVAGYLERALGEAEAVSAQLAAPELAENAARLLAHRLRGTAGSFGLVAIAAAAARLETGGSVEAGRADLAAALRATRDALAAEGAARPTP